VHHAASCELRSRFILIPGGGNQVAQAVLRGDADFGITISSEISSVKGVEIAGPLPPEMNQIGTAYGFLVPGTKQVAAGATFIAFMRSAEARRLMLGAGIDPK
jgi:ABC-type molybdate transport system substrate-binding protein